MARVFIGIPTLNRPLYVRDAIRSVVGQSFADFRVIVSDNVSEPEASASVERFVRELADPRFTFHRQPRDVGEYGQGRYFLRQAGAAPVAFMIRSVAIIQVWRCWPGLDKF